MTRPHAPMALRRPIVADAKHRCGYCLTDEWFTGIPLTVEHIEPFATGGTTTRENLWMSCHPCNEFKGTRTHAMDPVTGETVPLFNPRTQVWTEHFAWRAADHTQMIGLTPIGRATIVALQLNRPLLVRASALGAGRLASAQGLKRIHLLRFTRSSSAPSPLAPSQTQPPPHIPHHGPIGVA